MTDPIKQANETSDKYLALISIIEQIQNRLQWSELGYIALNLLVFFPSIFFVSLVLNNPNHFLILFVLFGFVIGMSINAYWVVSSIRLQLKLKLRYFQARNLERKNDKKEEFFISDESRFFNPEIGNIESPDGMETISFPKKGALRMDGFIGSAKPRYLSIMIPSILFIIHIVSFYTVLYFIVLQG